MPCTPEALERSHLCSGLPGLRNRFSFPEVCLLPPVAGSPGMSPRMACLGLSPKDPLLLDRLSAIQGIPDGDLVRAPPASSPSTPSLPRSPCRWPETRAVSKALSSSVTSPGTTQDSGRVPAESPPPQVTAHLASGTPYPWLTVLPQLLPGEDGGHSLGCPGPVSSGPPLISSFQPRGHSAGADHRSPRVHQCPGICSQPQSWVSGCLWPHSSRSLPTTARSRSSWENLSCCPPAPPLPPASFCHRGLMLAFTFTPGVRPCPCPINIQVYASVREGAAASCSAPTCSSARCVGGAVVLRAPAFLFG